MQNKEEGSLRIKIILSGGNDINIMPKFISFKTWVYFSFGSL